MILPLLKARASATSSLILGVFCGKQKRKLTQSRKEAKGLTGKSWFRWNHPKTSGDGGMFGDLGDDVFAFQLIISAIPKHPPDLPGFLKILSWRRLGIFLCVLAAWRELVFCFRRDPSTSKRPHPQKQTCKCTSAPRSKTRISV